MRFGFLKHFAVFGHYERVPVVHRSLGEVAHDVLEWLHADVLAAEGLVPDVQVQLEHARQEVEVHAEAALLRFTKPRSDARVDLVEERQVVLPQVAYGPEGRVLEDDEVADVAAAAREADSVCGRAGQRRAGQRSAAQRAPVLVEAQTPRCAVEENTLVGVFEVVVDNLVYPLVSRQSAFVVYELRHAFAVVFVVAGEHVFHCTGEKDRTLFSCFDIASL